VIHNSISNSDEENFAQPTEKWAIIINPASATGKGRKIWPSLQKALVKKNIPFVYEFSEQPDDIYKLVVKYLKKEFLQFAILGGDGSLHLLVNSLMKVNPDQLSKIKVAFFPAGTGNDWRKTHGIRMDFHHTLELILKNQFSEHDVGVVKYQGETRYFINILGAGLDAKAVSIYHKYISGIKIGKFKYILSLILALLRYKKDKVRMECDGQLITKQPILNLNIGICQYSGGGMRTIPHAKYDDGILEGVWILKIGLIKVILNLKKLFNGTYIEMKEISQFRGKEINLEFEKDTMIEADGEILGPADKFEIGIIPSAIRIVSGIRGS
jgi:YegS/Rv2252/BmrU family lipid kinase